MRTVKPDLVKRRRARPRPVTSPKILKVAETDFCIAETGSFIAETGSRFTQPQQLTRTYDSAAPRPVPLSEIREITSSGPGFLDYLVSGPLLTKYSLVLIFSKRRSRQFAFRRKAARHKIYYLNVVTLKIKYEREHPRLVSTRSCIEFLYIADSIDSRVLRRSRQLLPLRTLSRNSPSLPKGS